MVKTKPCILIVCILKPFFFLRNRCHWKIVIGHNPQHIMMSMSW
ncbi:hypothetical protein LC052_03640 [Priestia flexa]|nr:hypothetical protein [Priestia flexa]